MSPRVWRRFRDCFGPIPLSRSASESFDVNEALIEQFEDEHNVSVTFIAAGDANEVVNRAVLNAGNPEGDVLFGVDNLSFHRAVEAGVFSEFRAERRDEIPADLRTQFGDSLLLTPVDFGFVNLNFDAAAGDPPQTLEELTEPKWKGKLVVEDPGRSSPGLQFLAPSGALATRTRESAPPCSGCARQPRSPHSVARSRCLPCFPTHRPGGGSTMALAFGARTGVRIVSIPIRRARAMKSPP